MSESFLRKRFYGQLENKGCIYGQDWGRVSVWYEIVAGPLALMTRQLTSHVDSKVRIKEGLVEAEPSSRVWYLCDRAHVLDHGKVSAGRREAHATLARQDSKAGKSDSIPRSKATAACQHPSPACISYSFLQSFSPSAASLSASEEMADFFFSSALS